MKPRIGRQCPDKSVAHRQRGIVLLLMVILLMVSASYLLLTRLNSSQLAINKNNQSADALGEARTALLGYALASQQQPGALPCPDSDNDGISNPPPPAVGPCTAAVARLPWRTLGLADLRDAGNERLWYALAPAFDGSGIINSETSASLRINAGTTAIAAVILAPGAAVPGQNRLPGAQNDLSQYLEDDNANNDNNYVTAAAGDFNDQLLSITQTDLLQATERRVLQEVRRQLRNYYNDNGAFPYAATPGDASQACDNNVSQGFVPLAIGALPASLNPCTTPDWTASPTAALPGWFAANGWDQLIWYAVAPACAPPGCITVQNTPTPNNNKEAILIAAGPPLAGQTRPPPPPIVSNLLDSAENSDGLNLIFEQLPVDILSNDQILVVSP